MAKVALNPIFEKVQGRVGDLVLKQVSGEMVMARLPDLSNVEPSLAQLETRQRFQAAALYGKTALAETTVREAYVRAANERHKPLFSVPVADFLNAPVVDEVNLSGYTGQAGETISVRAYDDFEVTNVTVSIREAGGQEVESGAAVQNPPDSGRWVYTTHQAVADASGVTVTATASDRPGNTGIKTAAK